MLDAARGQRPVERFGTGVEPIVILGPAIEVDFQAAQIGGARQCNGVVSFPKRGIGR